MSDHTYDRDDVENYSSLLRDGGSPSDNSEIAQLALARAKEQKQRRVDKTVISAKLLRAKLRYAPQS